MAFNGTEGSVMPLTEAAELTANFRAANPDQTKAVFYGKDNLMALLEQSGSMGIRMYFAQEDGGAMTLVLVSATADENDDLSLVIERGSRCPPFCSGANALNGGNK